MNAYKFNTRISDSGTIVLPYEPHLYDMDVEVFIVPLSDKKNKQNVFSANDFINKWQGCIQGMSHLTDEELDNIKYQYLKEKHS